MEDKPESPLRELLALRLKIYKLSIAALWMVCILLVSAILWWFKIPIALLEMWVCAIVLRFAIDPYLRLFPQNRQGLAFTLLFVVLVAFFALIGFLVWPEASHQFDELRNAASGQASAWYGKMLAFVNAHSVELGRRMDTWVQHNVSTYEQVWEYVQPYVSATPGYFGSVVTMLGYGFMIVMFTASIIADDYIAFIASLFGSREVVVKVVLERTRDDVGRWAWAQLAISSAFGVTFGFILWLLGVPFAIAIGLLAVLMDLIPYGNVVALLLALLAVLTDMPAYTISVNFLHLAAVGVTWLVLSQTVAEFVQPRVMNKVLHIRMFFTLSFVFGGFAIDGIFGALMAMPCLIFTRSIFYQIYPKYNPVAPNKPRVPFVERWARRWAAICRLCARVFRRR